MLEQRGRTDEKGALRENISDHAASAAVWTLGWASNMRKLSNYTNSATRLSTVDMVLNNGERGSLPLPC